VPFNAGGGSETFANMHRTRRYKLAVYHGKGVGELFDLKADPWEPKISGTTPLMPTSRADF
tara:strand:+ start:1121 stop:1303 length:183 start_codon:yes stop_codon:yes gene_type:complete